MPRMRMIALYTDFGVADPYLGQMHAVLARTAPDVRIIDLFHSVPNFDIRAGAYLLPALATVLPTNSIFVGVVDPGVGGSRRPVIIEADGCWYVGPDNGLFELVARRARTCACYAVRWRPEKLSASFHGRDLFVPIAARLALGQDVDAEATMLTPQPAADWPDDLARILYIDHYGNGLTGLRASHVNQDQILAVNGRRIRYARVFAAAPPNEPFWHENANGLVEIAVNQGDAARLLGLGLGARFDVV